MAAATRGFRKNSSTGCCRASRPCPARWTPETAPPSLLRPTRASRRAAPLRFRRTRRNAPSAGTRTSVRSFGMQTDPPWRTALPLLGISCEPPIRHGGQGRQEATREVSCAEWSRLPRAGYGRTASISRCPTVARNACPPKRNTDEERNEKRRVRAVGLMLC